MTTATTMSACGVALLALLAICRADQVMTTEACGGKPADVFFLLDASRSIWGPDFRRQLAFVQNVAAQFDIRSSHTRVGVLTYGTYVRTEFDLNTHRGKAATLRAIGNIYQLHGLTRTDAALLRMRELMSRDVRPGVGRVAIVLTDGDSEYPALTREEAVLAHNAGIAILAVGIGKSVSRPELEAIASDRKYVFSATNFQALDMLKKILAIKTCEVSVDIGPGSGSIIDNTIDDSDTSRSGHSYNGNNNNNNNNGGSPRSSDSGSGKSDSGGGKDGDVTPPPKGCGGKPADLIFLLDGSSSIWGPDFSRQLRFVQDMVGTFDISPNTTRVGVVTFGAKPHVEFQLGEHRTEAGVVAAVGGVRHLRGQGTDTGRALRHLSRHSFAATHARPDVVHIAIVITDGRSDDRKHTARAAEHARRAGIHLFAIGVGANTDFRELADIASQPTSTHVFQVTNYEALSTIRELLAIETCKVTDPPTTQPPPTTTTMPTTTTTTTDPTTTTTTTIMPTTTTTIPPPADQGCGENSPADLVFALPPLANPDDTKTVLNFIKDLIQEFDVQDGSVRLGLVPKDCLSVPGFNLRSFKSTDDMLSSFQPSASEYQLGTSDVLRHMRSSSFLQADAPPMDREVALMVLDEEDDADVADDIAATAGFAAAHRGPVYTASNMAGKMASKMAAKMASNTDNKMAANKMAVKMAATKKIGVVFMDRDSASPDETAAEAGWAKDDGIEVFVVAIGKKVSDKEAHAVAMSKSHVFHTADYGGLGELKELMLETMNDACSGLL